MNFNAPKSNQKAEALRARGCQDLKKGKLYDALLWINKSLCLAERCSPTVGLIYANRADIYFHLKLFDKCLNNIEHARNESCPKDSLCILNELEEKCLNQLDEFGLKTENPWEFFKLSHTPSKKLPFIIDCLDIKCDKKFGRFIVSNKPLNVGDIIAIEEPFFRIVKTEVDDKEYPETNVYQYCANCLTDNLMDLIPCSRCITTMFCSKKCLESAAQGFHQYECSILPALSETGNWRMTFKNFFHALSICDGSIEKLEKLMQESDELSSTSVFNYDFSDVTTDEYLKNQLMCMLSLERKVEVDIKDFSEIFMQQPKLAKMWPDHKQFINRFLERMMQVEILNFHGIKGRSLSKSNPYRACLGDGGYTFSSLINHSCCPNVMRICVDSRMVMIVERPIKPGEQLFDCYIG